MSVSHRLGIALMGKGATNHLHRSEVVDAFRERGVEVHFIVRDDYYDMLEKLPGCEYTPCRVSEPTGVKGFLLGLFRYVRSQYPSTDKERDFRFRVLNRDRKWRSRLFYRLIHFIACYRGAMELVAALEKGLYSSTDVVGPDPGDIDQLLLLGTGSAGTEMEGILTWWARRRGISVVHAVGNYDYLTSRGFHCAPIEKLLVWGPGMRRAAENVLGIPSERIVEVGATRYNSIEKVVTESREDFLKSIGLEPEGRVILFAGSADEFHYFEMLEAYERIREEDGRCQLIMRVYPNKRLMNSPYIGPLLDAAGKTPGVAVSLGDPHFRRGVRDREVLQIEETELWHSLKYCDVVVNLYSTIALEACLFGKPAVHMWYFRPESFLVIRKPVYGRYPDSAHNSRLFSYGALREARSRDELIRLIKEAAANPGELALQRERTVAEEIGVVDGKACHRLAGACVEEFRRKKKKPLPSALRTEGAAR